MPPQSPHGQAGSPSAWFGVAAGSVLLQSEHPRVVELLADTRGLPWLWLAPQPPGAAESLPEGRGLRLHADGPASWLGMARCGPVLPLASESVGVVVLQHVLRRDADGALLLDECARVLAPGGRLALLTLNPLSPYRWRWRGAGLRATEPLAWRRRLRAAGLTPEPLSLGIGPSWREAPAPLLQPGIGLRAAYLLRAEKRSQPLTPVRQRQRVVLGVPAT